MVNIKRYLTIIGLILMVTGIAIFALIDKNKEAMPDEGSVKMIEDAIAIRMPASIEVINFEERNNFIDPSWVAQISISKKDLELVKLEIAKKKEDNTEVVGALRDQIRWWKPNGIIFSKQYLADSSTLVNIIIADRDSTSFNMFVECNIF